MSRGGAIGGAATLSSYRVQKAFSINFRENKRLVSEIRLIENEHIRNIRHVKQEIKETRMWLENIRESTGESQYGLRPDSEPGQSRRKKKPPPRSKTALPDPVERRVHAVSDYGDDDDDAATKYSEQEPNSHVRFDAGKAASKDMRTQRPWTEANHKGTKQLHRAELKSEPAPILQGSQSDVTQEQLETKEPEKNMKRALSATSVRSSLASLTVRQRRHKLQSMSSKKVNPLEYKRQLITKENKRVNFKVSSYLSNLSERMSIPMTDLREWGINDEHHDTPFAQDINVT